MSSQNFQVGDVVEVIDEVYSYDLTGRNTKLADIGAKGIVIKHDWDSRYTRVQFIDGSIGTYLGSELQNWFKVI